MQAKQQLIEEWQLRWDASRKGRLTYQFFLNIEKRLIPPIWLNHLVTQFLTGHGDFRAKLYGFRLKPDPHYACGAGEETTEHVLFHCLRTQDHCSQLESLVIEAGHQ